MRRLFLARQLPAILCIAMSSCFLVTAQAAETLRKITIEHDAAPKLAAGFRARGFDVLEGSVRETELALIVSPAEYNDLIAQRGKSNWKIISIERGQPLKDLLPLNTANGAVPNGYFDLGQINQRLVDVAASYPDITELVNLTQRYGVAQTFENRDIFALKISDNPTVDEDEPSLLIVSNHHAREMVTPVIALDAIDRLTSNYASDPLIAAAVDNNTIWIAPTWNPDGYDEVINGDNFWRKNRRVLPGGIGIDLNRNYPTGWSSPCSGSTLVPSQTYKGTAPASEPETQLMMAWSEDQRFTKVIDYHSFGREVLYGYSCTSHPFTSYFLDEAVDLSFASDYAGSNRPAGAEGEHYQWQLERFGAWSHLIETEAQFQPTFAAAQSESNRVWPGILFAINRPVPLTGRVTDSLSGDPVAASIVFEGVNFALNEEFSSNSRFGRYNLFAPDDTYTLSFSAPGYVTQQQVVQIGVTNSLDIQLVPDVIDSDGDGVDDAVDNCTLVSNASQFDGDSDGYGNACDADVNGDCSVNFLDVSIISGGFLTDDPVLDLNGDGVVNFIDFAFLPDAFLLPPGPSGLVSSCP